MVRELLGRLGYEVEIVVLGNWKRCLMDAAAGRVDVVLAYNSDQRDQGMRFSTVPVLREEVAVFVNQRRPVRFEHLDDLAGYRGGLLYGESYGPEFDRFVARHQNIEWVSSSQQNFGKLIRGRIDFVIQGAAYRPAVRRAPAWGQGYPRLAHRTERGLSARCGFATFPFEPAHGCHRPAVAQDDRGWRNPALAGAE